MRRLRNGPEVHSTHETSAAKLHCSRGPCSPETMGNIHVLIYIHMHAPPHTHPALEQRPGWALRKKHTESQRSRRRPRKEWCPGSQERLSIKRQSFQQGHMPQGGEEWGLEVGR